MLVQRLLNKAIDSAQVKQLQGWGFPYDFITLPSGGVGFQHSSNMTFAPEELMAMTFQNIISISETDAEQAVKDCVITVPEFMSQNERQALIDAASLAGLNVLSLLNQNTAFAIQYGLDLKYESDVTKRVLFYNMGSSSTIVSLVEFTSYQKFVSKKENKTIGQLEVKSVAWDENLGGNNFDMLIADYIKEKFQALLASKGDKSQVTSNPRAMAKIRKAAADVKKTLSANKDVPINIASLLNDIDFRATITRDTFNELAKNLIDKALQPLSRALSDAGVTADQVDSLVILGGSPRIPAILEQLRVFAAGTIGKEVASNIDADEAGAMGAVIRAANLSTAFQVRKFGLVDVTPFSVGVKLGELPAAPIPEPEADAKADPAANEESGVAASTRIATAEQLDKTAQLFKRFSRLVKKKTVTFSHERDFSISLFHENPEQLVASNNAVIANYNITGVEAIITDAKYAAALASGQKPKISISFILDSSGMVELVRAEATLEETIQVLVAAKNASKSTNGTASVGPANATSGESAGEAGAASSESGADETDDSTQDKSATDEEPEVSTSAAASEGGVSSAAANDTVVNATGTGEAAQYVNKTKLHRIKLKSVRFAPSTTGYVRNMDIGSKVEAKQMLKDFAKKDEDRAKLFAAKNSLEAAVFDYKNKMEEADVISVTTAEQREALITVCNSAGDWLSEQPESTPITGYQEKLAEVKQLYNPIAYRVYEIAARPEALARTLEALNQTQSYIARWVNQSWISNTTEYKQLVNLTANYQEWLANKTTEQEAKQPHEDAAYDSNQLRYKIEPIGKLVNQLLKRKPPVPPLPKMPKFNASAWNATANSTANSTAPSDGEAAPGTSDEASSGTDGQSESEGSKSDQQDGTSTQSESKKSSEGEETSAENKQDL